MFLRTRRLCGAGVVFNMCRFFNHFFKIFVYFNCIEYAVLDCKISIICLNKSRQLPNYFLPRDEKSEN